MNIIKDYIFEENKLNYNKIEDIIAESSGPSIDLSDLYASGESLKEVGKLCKEFKDIKVSLKYGLEKKMNKTNLETYNWTKRLLVINLKSQDKEKLSYVDNWLFANKCKIEDRNINIVFFKDFKNKKYKTSPSTTSSNSSVCTFNS